MHTEWKAENLPHKKDFVFQIGYIYSRKCIKIYEIKSFFLATRQVNFINDVMSNHVWKMSACYNKDWFSILSNAKVTFDSSFISRRLIRFRPTKSDYFLICLFYFVCFSPKEIKNFHLLKSQGPFAEPFKTFSNHFELNLTLLWYYFAPVL